MILGALVWMVPQTAQATGIFDRIARWTDSFFELLSSDQEDSSSEYVFETDNPALQQVYDAVVELGVTEPVVPMWLPGDYELKNKQVINEFDIINWGVELIDGEKSAIYQIIIYSQNVPSGYCKDNMVLEVCEIDGIEYNIIRNDGYWSAVWTRDNIECAITLDCQEDELYKMLESIYAMEDE